MGKCWSLLFGVVMAICFLLCVAAPFMGWWMPAGFSTHAAAVDSLFYIILAITGIFFVLTEAILVAFIWQYGKGSKPVPSANSIWAKILAPVTNILNDAHKLEMAWTLVPALILLYIAFAQVSTWAEVKYQSRMAGYMEGKTPVQAVVSARQFEWRVRYPNHARMEEWLSSKDHQKNKDFTSFFQAPHSDDVHVVNEVHTWKGQPILIQLSTLDVIHSFNIPQMRIKQDALPGKNIPLWFTPTHANCKKSGAGWVDGIAMETGKEDRSRIWELACAELCGWGHYRMIGKLYVHESKEDFLAWLKQAEEIQNRDTTAGSTKVAGK